MIHGMLRSVAFRRRLQPWFVASEPPKSQRLVNDMLLCVFQEKTVQLGETLAQELKASQEKTLSEASERHVKEVQELQQELSSSKHQTQKLHQLVSELQPYKEQVQVRPWRCPDHHQTRRRAGEESVHV